MIYQVIATRDIVANVYSTPMFVPHIGQAIRSFGDECQRKEKGNILAEHPEDFELYLLGTYNDEIAEFDTTTRHQLAVGANYRGQR
ncbi:nonstructural protein [robinz microvirus RP_71]|nr:nonstructural protein [robinz microvirus RP_71]